MSNRFDMDKELYKETPKGKKIAVAVVTAIALVLLVLIGLTQQGCSGRKFARIEMEGQELKAYTYGEWWQCFEWRKIDDIYLKSTATEKEFSIGSLDAKPDTDSVKAVTEGVVRGVVEGLAPLK